MSQNPAVRIKNLKFAWPKQPPILDIAEMEIAAGEKVMLAGPSGSGKSTLLGLITGIVEGATGELHVLGQDCITLPAGKRDTLRADYIGYIFQSFNLIPYLSVVQNVVLPCRLSNSRAQALSTSPAAAAKHLLKELGLKDPSLLKRPVTELSIGQQQRVAAARALIGSPRLIIADEPTSSLDEDVKRDFLELLLDQSNKANSAVLFVSHDKTLIPNFDRALMLEDINMAYQPEAI